MGWLRRTVAQRLVCQIKWTQMVEKLSKQILQDQ